MKVFLSFLQGQADYPIPAYNFWQHYIKNGIKEAGHQWQECPDADWALGLVPKSKADQSLWLADTWSKTVEWLKENPTDIFLSYLYPEQIDVTALNEIKQLGIPCVNFFCDNVRQFKRIPNEFSVFNLNWVPEHGAVEMYEQAGYAYVNLPMPMWVSPELRVIQSEINNQVTFIGSKDIQRQMLFEKIIAADEHLPLAIYGNGWKETSLPKTLPPRDDISKKLFHQYLFLKNNGPMPYLRKLTQRTIAHPLSAALKQKAYGTIDFESYIRLTAGSMITAGVNRYPSFRFPLSAPGSYSRLRDMEAPMLGACYLTEYTAGIDQLYEIGTEIETYTNSDDFIDKVNELQANFPKRKILKANGQKRALQDHSISRSIERLLKQLH